MEVGGDGGRRVTKVGGKAPPDVSVIPAQAGIQISARTLRGLPW